MNQLTVNLAKTCFSVFSNKNSNSIETLKWGDTIICRVPCTKYLGIYVDEKLSWKQHIEFVRKKLCKLTYVFRVLSQYIDKKQICQLYYAYVYPHIYYAIEVYGTCSNTAIKTLQVTQNNLLRVLLRVNRRFSATAIHKELGILKVCNVFEKAVLTFVHKGKHNLLPCVFNDYYHNITERNIRSKRLNDLYVEFSRTSGGMKSIRILGAKLWNKLPTELKDVQSSYNFKKMAREYLLDKCA